MDISNRYIICYFATTKTVTFTDYDSFQINFPITFSSFERPTVTSSFLRQYATIFEKSKTYVKVHLVCPNKSTQENSGVSGIAVGV